MSSDETQFDRLATRRKVLVASGSTAMLGLAGCIGDDDETDGTDDDGVDDTADDGTDDDTGDDGMGDEQQEVMLLVESATDDRNYAEEGLDEHAIDHACGHMEFDDPEPLEGGESDGDAPVIDETHQPFAVSFEGQTGYVRFEAPDSHDHDAVSRFDIIDRSEDEVVADVHDDHWHGSLPEVPIDDNISLGASIEDDHGDEIELDGHHYELGVDLADGADDIVEFDYHGDHVHIIGTEEGMTEVVFQLWHDDHVEYETPPIVASVGDHDHDADHAHIETFEIIDRSEDEVAAYVDGDHWHGDLPSIPVDDNVSLGAFIEDDHGDEITLDGDHYELRVDVAHGDEDDDIVWFDHHGDHVHIYGEEDGTTEVVFELWHDDHVEYETPPIVAAIGDADPHDHDGGHDHVHVEEFEVIDRSEDEVTAYIHGDHWHGDLPEVPVDDNISLGASITDDHGDEIELDGHHYELGVDLADGADDIVEFDYHGDHVHIIGTEEGTTEVVFQLLHDGHVEYETPAIEAHVESGGNQYSYGQQGGATFLSANGDDHNGQPYAFFTEEGEVDAVVGEKLYEEHGVDGCADIDMYVLVEPDHGEVVLELSP